MLIFFTVQYCGKYNYKLNLIQSNDTKQQKHDNKQQHTHVAARFINNKKTAAKPYIVASFDRRKKPHKKEKWPAGGGLMLL